jgi:hypothetical protein
MSSVTIVIPCFTEQRWDSLLRAVRSALEQTHPCDVTVVVDHNDVMLRRLQTAVGHQVEVMANRFPQGASGARNTGAFAATSELVAFLEDDAYAEPTWVEQLLRARRAAPDAVGLGGAIRPIWADGGPRWFPDEFSWAVGATVPRPADTDVRNVWGGNMMVVRRSFQEAPAERSTLAFFLRRCWSEGAGKAALSGLAESGAKVLDEEAAFIRSVVPRGLVRHLWAAVRGDAWGLARFGAIVAGTAMAGAGYLRTRVRPARAVTRLSAPAAADTPIGDATGDAGVEPASAVDDRRPRVVPTTRAEKKGTISA